MTFNPRLRHRCSSAAPPALRHSVRGERIAECPRSVRGHLFRMPHLGKCLNANTLMPGSAWHRTCSKRTVAALWRPETLHEHSRHLRTRPHHREARQQEEAGHLRRHRRRGAGLADLVGAGRGAPVFRGFFGERVAAVSPTLYARAGGAVVLQVHAGDKVTKGQVLAVIASPELTNQLAQEENNQDAMQVAWQQSKVDANQQRSKLQEAYDNANIDQQSAARDLKRYQEAYDKGAVSQLDVDRHR